MAEKYGVSDMDLVTFKVSGTVSKDGVLTVSKIRNYRIPEDKLYQNGGYIDGGYVPTTTDTPGVTVQPQGEVLRFKIARTQAESKEFRNELMADFACKKSDITIEELELPITKNELVFEINSMLTETYEAAVRNVSGE